MRTNEKREAALKILAATGIWPSSYAPPLVRLLWRLGLDVPPPHLRTFCANALFTSTFFAAGWGLFMWMFVWFFEDIAAAVAFACAVGAGVLFGLGMASYYAYGRRTYHLPLWKELSFPR